MLVVANVSVLATALVIFILGNGQLALKWIRNYLKCKYAINSSSINN